MEKQKSKIIEEIIVVTVVVICLSLILLQLEKNIHNELIILFG